MASPQVRQTCINCAHSYPLKEDFSEIECRRYPPRLGWSDLEDAPQIMELVIYEPKTFFCGEHKVGLITTKE